MSINRWSPPKMEKMITLMIESKCGPHRWYFLFLNSRIVHLWYWIGYLFLSHWLCHVYSWRNYLMNKMDKIEWLTGKRLTLMDKWWESWWSRIIHLQSMCRVYPVAPKSYPMGPNTIFGLFIYLFLKLMKSMPGLVYIPNFEIWHNILAMKRLKGTSLLLLLIMPYINKRYTVNSID